MSVRLPVRGGRGAGSIGPAQSCRGGRAPHTRLRSWFHHKHGLVGTVSPQPMWHRWTFGGCTVPRVQPQSSPAADASNGSALADDVQDGLPVTGLPQPVRAVGAGFSPSFPGVVASCAAVLLPCRGMEVVREIGDGALPTFFCEPPASRTADVRMRAGQASDPHYRAARSDRPKPRSPSLQPGTAGDGQYAVVRALCGLGRLRFA